MGATPVGGATTLTPVLQQLVLQLNTSRFNLADIATHS